MKKKPVQKEPIPFKKFSRHGKVFIVLKIDRKIQHIPETQWPLIVRYENTKTEFGHVVRKFPFPNEELVILEF